MQSDTTIAWFHHANYNGEVGPGQSSPGSVHSRRTRMRTMSTDLPNLDALAEQARAALAAAADEAALEQFRLEFLSRGQGKITQIKRGLRELPPEERPRVGASINRLSDELEAAYEARLEELRRRALAE